jgi:hypothetical protein
MDVVVAIIFALAFICAVLRACGVTTTRLDLGWLAIALVIAGLWIVPPLQAV